MSWSWAGGSDSRWRSLRAYVLARDRNLCRIGARGCTRIATCVDHIIQLEAGGEKYDETNCRAACEPCNLGRARPRPQPEPEPKRISSW